MKYDHSNPGYYRSTRWIAINLKALSGFNSN